MLKTAHTHTGTKQVHLGGWKKQSVDARDAAFAVKVPSGLALGTRPASADLRAICSPVEDQGQLGSCTANMFAALVEANENRRLAMALKATTATVGVTGIATDANGVITFTTTVTPPAAPAPAPTPAPTPAPAPSGKLVRASRLFEYYASRRIEGTTSTDAGATIRDAIKAGVTYGVVDETVYPYDVNKFALNPPKANWDAALLHKVTSYHAITDGDIETMKVMLSGAVPFLVGFGFTVYDSFMTQQTATTGLVCRPAKGEGIQGGHAVTLVGYDDNKVMPDGSKGAFLVRNSWGTSWGVYGGHFWFAYNYMSDPALASDVWVVSSSPLVLEVRLLRGQPVGRARLAGGVEARGLAGLVQPRQERGRAAEQGASGNIPARAG